jgi:hypothetical protein
MRLARRPQPFDEDRKVPMAPAGPTPEGEILRRSGQNRNAEAEPRLDFGRCRVFPSSKDQQLAGHFRNKQF